MFLLKIGSISEFTSPFLSSVAPFCYAEAKFVCLVLDEVSEREDTFEKDIQLKLDPVGLFVCYSFNLFSSSVRGSLFRGM